MVVIVYPESWEEIGQEIQIAQIEKTLLRVLSDINCKSLSFSGGIDSTIMLYLMLKIFKEVKTFTIGLSEDHPDIKASRYIVKRLNGISHQVIIPKNEEIENRNGDLDGDNAVRFFYKKLTELNVNEIIACDGIDEFMCGYYDHTHSPNEETYYTLLRRLQCKQLEPLNKNSGNVRVYLPYITSDLIYLYSQISLKDKMRNGRKSIMFKLAERLGVPKEIIERRKYGFCDALKIKKHYPEKVLV